jgi:DNA-binding GntR family transcriptional regulator
MIPSVIGDHLRIIEALEARDPEAAAAAMKRHIEIARRRAVNMG